LASPKDSGTANALTVGVLIVDEDPSFRLGLQTFLKEFVGFEKIYSAANGLEALECLRENDDIEIVTLDQDMPEMDGLTFLRIVNDGDFPSLAAVMITGDPDADIEEKFRSLNSDKLVSEQFLEKPVDFNDLEAVLLDSYNSLKKREKAAVAKSTAAAVAAFAGGSAVAGALTKDEKSSAGDGEGEKESTNSQESEGQQKTMTKTKEKTKKVHVDEAVAKQAPADQNPVLEVTPSSNDKAGEADRGGADWIGAGPPQTGGGDKGGGASASAGNNELRARVDWLADSLNGRLDKIDAQLANVSSRTPSMAERFWLGLLKWATLGLLVWAFVRFEVGDQIVKYYGIARAKVVEMTTAGKSADLMLDPEGGEKKPIEGDATSVGNSGDQKTSDAPPARPKPAAEPSNPKPALPAAAKKAPPASKPEPVDPPKPAPSATPASVKAKSADADKPKVMPEPKPESKPTPKPAPSSSSAPADANAKPKAGNAGKGDAEKAKAKQRRQRKEQEPGDDAKPGEKPAPAPEPDAAGEPAAE
jgi:CheY-like chemotaxis protein